MAIEVKALACELPARLGLPLSRLFVPDIRDAVIARDRDARSVGWQRQRAWIEVFSSAEMTYSLGRSRLPSKLRP